MTLPIKGSLQGYLADLDVTQRTMTRAQAQVSSGLRVAQASDDPGAVGEIMQLQADMAGNKQVQANLDAARSEASSADSALQSAISAVQNAISLAAQGANTTSDAKARANIADQISGLQETLVSISRTSANGRYIFSGDQDNQPAYELDLSQPDGVSQLISSPATRQIMDANGVAISVARTAQQIFDPRNPDSTPATGNVFAAVNSLRTALLNNDQTGIAQSLDALRAADDHLNTQLSFYGQVENRLDDASALAQKFQLQQQQDLGQVRDADIPAAALALSQAQVQLQATLSVGATLNQSKNLFSFLA